MLYVAWSEYIGRSKLPNKGYRTDPATTNDEYMHKDWRAQPTAQPLRYMYSSVAGSEKKAG